MKNPEDYCIFGLCSLKKLAIADIIHMIILYCGIMALIFCNPIETLEKTENTPTMSMKKHYAIGVQISCVVLIMSCLIAIYGILDKKTIYMYPFLLGRVAAIFIMVVYFGMLAWDETTVKDVGPDIYPLNWAIDRVHDGRDDISLFPVLLFMFLALLSYIQIYLLYCSLKLRKRILSSSTLQISSASSVKT